MAQEPTDAVLQVVVRVITVLRRKTPQPINHVWAAWREALKILYTDGPEDASLLAQRLRVAQQFTQQGKLTVLYSAQTMRDFSYEDRVQALALVHLFLRLEEHTGAAAALHVHRQQYQLLTFSMEADEVSLEKLEQEATLRSEVLFRKGVRKEGVRTVMLDATVLPLLLDQLLRWTVLGMYQNQLLPAPVFWVCQTVGIVVPLQIYLTGRDRRVQRHLRGHLREFGLKKYQLITRISPMLFTVVVLLAGLGAALLGELEPGMHQLVRLALVVPYGLYLIYLLTNYAKPADLRAAQIRQIYTPVLMQDPSADSADKNDELIVLLEADLKATKERLDAYILESALLAGLAFSGFIQLISQEQVTINQVIAFTQHTERWMSSIAHFQVLNLGKELSLLSQKNELLVLLSFESLFCTVCFLSVIASRLRFSDYADRIGKSLALALTFNIKEEDTLERGKVVAGTEHRFRAFNYKIASQLEDARIHMDDMQPLLGYMRYFRNLGLFTFIVVNATAALLLSGGLSALFIALGLLSGIFFEYRRLRTWWQGRAVLAEEISFRLRPYWLWMAATSFLICLLLNIILLPGASIFLALSLIFVSIRLSISYFLERGNGPLAVELMPLKGRTAVYFLLPVSLLILIAGYWLKAEHIAGANEMLIIGMLIFSTTFLLRAAQTSEKRWQRWPFAIGVVLYQQGLLSNLLAFPGGQELLVVGMAVAVLGLLSYRLGNSPLSWKVLRAPLIILPALVVLFIVVDPTYLFRVSNPRELIRRVRSEKAYGRVLTAIQTGGSQPKHGASFSSLQADLNLLLQDSVASNHLYYLKPLSEALLASADSLQDSTLLNLFYKTSQQTMRYTPHKQLGLYMQAVALTRMHRYQQAELVVDSARVVKEGIPDTTLTAKLDSLQQVVCAGLEKEAK